MGNYEDFWAKYDQEKKDWKKNWKDDWWMSDEYMQKYTPKFEYNVFKLKSKNSKKIFMSTVPEYKEKFDSFVQKHDIKYVINLLQNTPIDKNHNKSYNILLFPIQDFSVPKLSDFIKFIDKLSNLIYQDNILIHCMGGHGRTGLIVMGILIHEYPNITVEGLLKQIRKIRPNLIESDIQLKFLKAYRQYITGK